MAALQTLQGDVEHVSGVVDAAQVEDEEPLAPWALAFEGVAAGLGEQAGRLLLASAVRVDAVDLKRMLGFPFLYIYR